MMGFRATVVVYLLGGVTFLPLLAVIIVAAVWISLPRLETANEISDGTGASQDRSEPVATGVDEPRSREQSLTGDTSVSGTFAVLRRYDLQAATAALNARSNSSGNVGGSNSLDGSVTGDHGFTATSESVYQSMYRSVFDRNKNASSNNSLTENDDEPVQGNTKPGRRKTTPASLMFIVLRHGHLMLYDSPSQVEVKYVISLAHYQISLKVGDGVEELDDSRNMREADLFIKRTAIVLQPITHPYGNPRPGQNNPIKPFYLFSNINIEREDFYHALLATRSQPPIPQALDTNALIKLQSNLHSVSLTPETRAINALIGRMFLALQQTDNLMDLVRSKIEKKLSRIQKPSFIPTLLVQSIEMGDAAPAFSNPRLRDLNISGDLTISADMRYNGGLSITLFAVAKLDLGTRFKARTVDLVLKTTIQRIQGTMLLRIKPPPSNRIWSCFEIMPEMDIRVEPVVSDRKITYGFVLRTIEDRLRSTIAEGLVKPNWDDTPMPLTDTRGSIARGGIWVDEGQEEVARSRSSSEPDKFVKKHDRTMSLPALTSEQMGDAQTSGLDSSVNSEINTPKLRHKTSTVPVDDPRIKRRPVTNTQTQSSSPGLERTQSTTMPPRPLRSPSLTASMPSVAVDGQNVEPVRSDDINLRQASMQNRRIWRSRGSDSSQPPKDALEELRVVRARAEQAIARPSDATLASPTTHRPEAETTDKADKASAVREPQLSGSHTTNATTLSRPSSLNRTTSEHSTTESITSLRSQQGQPRKQTILAATAAATSAARTWGWNAIQRNKGALPRGLGKKEEQQAFTQGEPMGRGQPLPPPGVPLPGPQKTLWSNVGNLRRKPAPALPPRRTQDPNSDILKSRSTEDIQQGTEDVDGDERKSQGEMDDEFGPWRENSGAADTEDDNTQLIPGENVSPNRSETATSSGVHQQTPDASNDQPHGLDQAVNVQRLESKPKKAPPPLPARPHVSHESPRKEQTHLGAEMLEDALNNQEEPATDQSDDGSGLRVPEAAAEAVAAENATPDLAQGSMDDFSRTDTISKSTILIDGNPSDEAQDLDFGHNDLATDPGEELQRIETKERFASGEDLEEKDFKHRSSSTSETVPTQQ